MKIFRNERKTKRKGKKKTRFDPVRNQVPLRQSEAVIMTST